MSHHRQTKGQNKDKVNEYEVDFPDSLLFKGSLSSLKLRPIPLLRSLITVHCSLLEFAEQP